MLSDFSTVLAPSLGIFAAALVLDALCGEAPNALHPVAWIGSAATFLLRLAPRGHALAELAFGALLASVLPLACAGLSAALLLACARYPLLQVATAVVLVKSTFAIRGLGRASLRVRDALAAGQIEVARDDLRSLCSRNSQTLDAPLVCAATVESLAENASDSIVAPFFFYALFGLPGAMLYRTVNTLDAMIGYRGRYEYLGKASARFDDLLNLVPSRLTAVLLLIAGVLSGGNARNGLRVLRRDAGKTASPNAGHPMAAMAGLLGVALEKTGHYRLGEPEIDLDPFTIEAAWRTVVVCAALAAMLAALAIGARGALSH